MILFISGPEIGFIIFIVVLLFGADKIPDFARNLGKGINNIKQKPKFTENLKFFLLRVFDTPLFRAHQVALQ